MMKDTVVEESTADSPSTNAHTPRYPFVSVPVFEIFE